MSEKVVLVRVGAAADASLKNVWLPFTQGAARARSAVEKESRAGAQAQVRATQQSGQAAARANDQLSKAFAKAEAERTKAVEREAQRRSKAEIRAFDERVKASAKARAAEEKDILAVAKTAEREAVKRKRQEDRDRQATVRSAREFGGKVAGTLGSLGRGAIGLGRDVASGAGVDLSIGSLIKRNVDLDKTVRKIANSDALAHNRTVSAQDTEGVSKLIKETGGATKMDYGDIASGLDEFVARSSDLETAKKTLTDLGHIAQATGTDFGELGGAMGDASNALEDGPEKAKQILEIASILGKQAASGAVEWKDMASVLGKVTGMTNRMEGSRVENLGQLGALAQAARKWGGAESASVAMTSAQRFVTDLTKGPNLKKFGAAGIDVFADKGHTKVRSPEKIITEAFEKTGGDLGKMTKLFGNVMSQRTIMGLSDIFQKEGTGGIHKYFKEMGAGIDPGQLKAAADNAEGGTSAKVADLNNKLADSMSRLVPVLESLLPHIEKAGKLFGDLATWVAKNPWESIAIALGASVAKAGIGEAIKGALTRVIGGAGGGGAAGGAGIGTAGAALAIAAMSVATFYAGKAIIDGLTADFDKKTNEQIGGQANARNIANAMRAGDKSQGAAARAQLDALRGSIRQSGQWNGYSPMDATNLADAGLNSLTNGMAGQSMESVNSSIAARNSLGGNIADMHKLFAESVISAQMPKKWSAFEAGKGEQVAYNPEVKSGGAGDKMGQAAQQAQQAAMTQQQAAQQLAGAADQLIAAAAQMPKGGAGGPGVDHGGRT